MFKVTMVGYSIKRTLFNNLPCLIQILIFGLGSNRPSCEWLKRKADSNIDKPVNSKFYLTAGIGYL